MITLVAVVGPKGELGAAGGLLYSLRDDMRHFKEYTMGHPIVMGRKTFESFPKRPLPGRTNIVVTRRGKYSLPESTLKASSVEEALDMAARCPGGDNIMVVGGGEVYRQAIDLATDLELTVVDAAPEAEVDTWFPEIKVSEWMCTTDNATVDYDSRSGLPFRLVHYRRKI